MAISVGVRDGEVSIFHASAKILGYDIKIFMYQKLSNPGISMKITFVCYSVLITPSITLKYQQQKFWEQTNFLNSSSKKILGLIVLLQTDETKEWQRAIS